MSSATRLIEIMNMFTAQRPTWTPLEVGQALRMSRASAYRFFEVLTDAGYLARVPGHRYALGPRIVELDRQIRLTDRLVQVSVDEMMTLAKQTGGVALLCRLYQDRVLCVHQERGSRASGLVSYERGRAMPLYRGATSKAVLALLPEERLASLIERDRSEVARSRLPHTARAMYDALAAIREQRICVSIGEVDPGACGVGVPLCETSRVIGSLSVVLPAAEAKGRLLKSAMRLVSDAGQRIELELEGSAVRGDKRRKTR
jgi:DNA-binding IclR family transcriptional regulator